MTACSGRFHAQGCAACPAGTYAVGRAALCVWPHALANRANNAIVIEDQFVSAEHAILTFRGRAWLLEDLGSTNGTFVNGAPVEGVAPLGFGDVIQLGQVRLRLERPRAARSGR